MTQPNIFIDTKVYFLENTLTYDIKNEMRNCNSKFQRYWWLQPEWQSEDEKK